MKIRPIIQEEETGCGLACVAMLCGKTYEEVCQDGADLGIRAADKRLWSSADYVRRLLTHYGMKAGKSERSFTGWDTLPDLCLLATKWHIEDGQPFWHWCVFSRKENESVVLDPAAYLSENTRHDFDAIEVKWFIEVG